MYKILIGYILTYTFVFSILIISNILKNKFRLTNEFLRKFVHITVSFTWIIIVYFFKDTWHLLIPPITFLILNYISYKKDIFNIERKNSNSKGTIYYALSMVLLSLLSMIDNRFIIPYGIGVFILSFGDGLAPFFGKSIKSCTFKIFKSTKTLAGSLTVFIISIIVLAIFTFILNLDITLLEIIIISSFSTILELIGLKGVDNLTLPIGSALITYLFLL